MASISLKETKSGKRFFLIQVSRGRGKSPYQRRWYWPDGWSRRAAERAAQKIAVEFEGACHAGKVENREERRERERLEKEARAKLKTFRDYAKNVFMDSKLQTISENTRTSYELFLNKHIFPVIGDCLLVEISPAMIQKLLLDFQKQGYAHSTVVKLHTILSGVFTMAELDDSVPISPMRKVARPQRRKDDSEESQKALTVQQLQYVLDCLKTAPLKWKVYIYLLFDTGGRRGEISGLQWEDISFSAGTVTIRRNLQYTPSAGIFVASPKSGRTRIVDIGPETLELLRDLREFQSKTCISKWLFTKNGSAEPMHPQTPARYFKDFAARHNIQNFHPHILRHTSASLALTNGADVVSVSERLGHSDTAVTLRMYAHADPESIRRAGQAVRNAIKTGTEHK